MRKENYERKRNLKAASNCGKTNLVGPYQASIDSNWVITANTKVNPFSKLATGPATYSLDNWSNGWCTNALCDRKISKDKVVRACNCHSLRWQGFYPCSTLWGCNTLKPDLKHLSPNCYPLSWMYNVCDPIWQAYIVWLNNAIIRPNIFSCTWIENDTY